MRRVLGAMAAGAVLVGAGIAYADHANASPAIGCETVAWPNLLNWGQKRTVCDGPRRPDGSWERARELWTPAHFVPFRCSSSRYSISCSGGYHVGQTTQAFERYMVFDHNVPPGEPGWLPAGTVVIR